MTDSQIVNVFSGGLDSTVAVYWTMKYHDEHPLLCSFNYGQRHVTELDSAKAIAKDLGLKHAIVDMEDYGLHIQSSVLTSQDTDSEVPEGHYAEESMRQTVVPNRNMVMLSMAAGIAVAHNCTGVVTGVHAGDHAVYPDCRPEFIESISKTIVIANAGFVREGFAVHAPFVNMSKAAIVVLGSELGVPMELTWSCYKGGDIHCGRCSTCVERLEAFHIAGVEDRTPYMDSDYWKTVV